MGWGIHKMLFIWGAIVGGVSAQGLLTSNGTFRPRLYDPADVAANYDHRINIDLAEYPLLVRLGSDSEGASLTGTFSGPLVDAFDNQVGTGTAKLSLNFEGLLFDAGKGDPVDPAEVIGLLTEATSTGVLDLALDWDDPSLVDDNVTASVYGGFADPGAGNPRWGDLAGTSFNFIIREVTRELGVWVKTTAGTTVLVQGEEKAIHGDIHATVPVPEPSAALLALLLGSLGLIRRSRS